MAKGARSDTHHLLPHCHSHPAFMRLRQSVPVYQLETVDYSEKPHVITGHLQSPSTVDRFVKRGLEFTRGVLDAKK